MESADRALDHEDRPMQDWEFITSYVVSDIFLGLAGKLVKLPLFGRIFKSYLFNHFSISYDIVVNFIEAHEEASKMLMLVIQDSEFVRMIKEESMLNT